MESTETENEEQSSPNVFKVLSVDTPKRTNPTLLPNPTLENGRILPKNFRDQFTELNAWGKPLEDIDPYYENGKTFIVVTSNFRIFRYSSHHSLFLFDPLNTLRRFFIFILTHWVYSSIMTAVVLLDFTYLANSLSGAKSLPIDHGRGVRIVCFLAYLAEFFLKWMSMGFVMSPFTYLRSFWCWVDMVVLFDYFVREVGGHELAWLLSTSVLLKIIPYNSGLHLAFDFCLSCILRLKEMIIASIVVMSMLTILGVQMYMGVLTQKCVSNFNPSEFLNVTDEEWHRQWHLHSFNYSHWYYTDPSESSAKLCGNTTGSGKCPEGYTCLQGFGSNPDYGYTSFDSFGWGFLTVLRLVSQDFAEYLVHQIFLTAGHFHAVYFIVVIFFGTFGLGTFGYAVVAHYFVEMNTSREENSSSHQQNGHSNDRYPFSRVFQSWNLPPGFNSFRRKVHCFVFHSFSEVCITCIILLDVFLMTFNVEQPIFSQIFCWIYVFECIAKMFAESPADYFKKREHILDTMIIVIFVFTLFTNNDLLTSFLVLRMFKLFPRWPSLNFLIQSLVNTWKNYYHFFALLVIVLLVSAAQGVSYSNLLRGDTLLLDAPRWHYKDFEHSFMTVFRIACNEWIECMWDSLLIHGIFGFVLFIPTMLVVYLILTIAAAAIVSETGETFSKIEFQENALYSKFEDGLNRVCVPVTWLRSKINPGGENHNILEESPIHRESHLLDNAGGDSSPVPNSIGATDRKESIIDRILQNKYYSIVSIIVLLWCSFQLTFDDGPHHHHEPKLTMGGNETDHSEPSMLQLSVFYTDILFTIYFGVDVILNLLSCLLKRRFVTSGWIFDCVLITEMILNLTFYSPHTSPLHGFFYVKCFRLFMLVSRVEGLKAVIRGFTTEFTLLWRYVLAGLFILLSFDIQGVQLFQGKFGKCLDPDNGVTLSAELIANKSECIKANLSWTNSETNFDNVLSGVRPMFFILSINGWLSVLHDAVDTTGIDEQPVQEASYHNVFYIIYVMTFGCFFLFFTLVGIIIHYLRTDTYKGIFMSFDQFYEYKNKTRQLLAETHSPQREDASPEKIPEPTWRVLKFFYDVVSSPFFDKFIMCVIIYQLLTFAVDFYDLNEGRYQLIWTIIDMTHLFIMVVFIAEMICKLLGWRLHYFKNVYNRYDFVVVVAFIIGLIFRDFVEMYLISPMLLSMLRIFRIFQFEPFKRRAALCQKYLKSLGLVRPALLNLFLFLLINLFSFSLLFMAVFKNVKLRGVLDVDQNFQSFRHSISMLFKFCQLGGWDGAYPALSDVTDCQMLDPDQQGYCGSPLKASLMMFGYLAVSIFTCLNIYIVFILEIIKRLSENESKSQTNGLPEMSNNGNSSSTTNNSPFNRVSAKEFTNSSFAL